MIKVKIYKSKDVIKGFEIRGHANYAEYGSDIVCSAVTILAVNTIDTFTDILMMEKNIEYLFDNNVGKLILKDNTDIKNNHDSQLILKKFDLGIKSLKKHYGDFIRVDYMEV